MDLNNTYPYWAAKTGLTYASAQLDADLRGRVVLPGLVVAGAQIVEELAGHGHDVVVLDQRQLLESLR